MALTKLLCFVALLCVVIIESKVYNYYDDDEITAEFIDEKAVAITDPESFDLQKRGIGGLIAVATMSGLQLAGTAMQLWTALSEGCNYYPSICRDKDEIKRLEGVLNNLGKQYDDLYYTNQWKYLNLKESMINNEYILHYINDTVSKVENIGDMIDIITTKLSVDLRTMEKMYSSGNDSATLANLVGPFEFQLGQIEKMIEELKKSQIVGLVIQKAAEMFIGKTIDYVGKAISKAKGNNLPAGDNVVHRLSSSNTDLSPSKQSFWKKTKNLFKSKASSVNFAFKAVGSDIKRKFGTSLPKNMKKWWAASKSWKSFKTQFKSSFLKDTSTIGRVKNFFKNPKSSVKYGIKNFKFSPGQAFLQGIGLVVDGIQMYMDARQWGNVADELSKARKNYETYRDKVEQALAEVRQETTTLGTYWTDTINSFKQLVSSFENITTQARENKVFTDVFGLSGVPVDTSDAFFRTDFKVVSEKQLKGKQTVVINFFNANGKKLSTLRDKFKVQEILVSQTKDLMSNGRDINSIFETLKLIYKNFMSQVIKNYSSKLVERDVVCAASMLLPNQNEYDYYPLDVFRDAKCAIADPEFTRIQQEAARKRDYQFLDGTVKEFVPKDIKPSAILDLAKAKYTTSSQSRLRTFGNNLKEQDVVCSIATQFPDMNTYKFYDLSAFRPDCSRVSTTQFKQMTDAIKKLDEVHSAIGFSKTFCVKYKQCFASCPSDYANNGLTVQQVKLLIEEVKRETPPCNYIDNTIPCRWQC